MLVGEANAQVRLRIRPASEPGAVHPWPASVEASTIAPAEKELSALIGRGENVEEALRDLAEKTHSHMKERARAAFLLAAESERHALALEPS